MPNFLRFEKLAIFQRRVRKQFFDTMNSHHFEKAVIRMQIRKIWEHLNQVFEIEDFRSTLACWSANKEKMSKV